MIVYRKEDPPAFSGKRFLFETINKKIIFSFVKLKKFIKYQFEYFCLRVITRIIRFFPLKAGLILAKMLGRILYHLNKKHRERALNNLRQAFKNYSAEKLIKIIKEVYINLSKVYVEFLNFPRMDKKYFNEKIKIVGKNNLDEALKLNKGIIAISGHMDNWELLGSAVLNYGYRLDAVYHPMRNPYSNRFINRIREKAGIKLIRIDKAFRPVIDSLRQNHILGLIADQDAGKDGVFVDFFNRPASTAKGPAFFAVKTGSPVLMFTLIREKNDCHTLYISKPLKIISTGDIKRDIYYNTKLWSDELEKWVRKYPEQWFWVHRKWHSKPEQEKRA